MTTWKHLVSRSAVEQDWICPRSRYWQTVYGRVGIVGLEVDPALSLGSVLHRGVAAIRHGESWQTCPDVAEFLATAAPDVATLLRGWLLGYQRVVHPALLREFEIVSVEQELTREFAPQMALMVQPDLVLRSRVDGGLWYWEDKTTGAWDMTKWFRKFQREIQVHAGADAIRLHYGEPVQGILVQAYRKGSVREQIIHSAFTTIYRRNVSLAGEVQTEYRVDYARGWEKAYVWQLPGGIDQWVATMPEDVLLGMFPRSTPIHLHAAQVDTLYRQLGRREAEITHAAGLDGDIQSDTLEQVFPQYFLSCEPLGRQPCVYQPCCFSPGVGEHPLASGYYQVRVPHHAMERTLLGIPDPSPSPPSQKGA